MSELIKQFIAKLLPKPDKTKITICFTPDEIYLLELFLKQVDYGLVESFLPLSCSREQIQKTELALIKLRGKITKVKSNE